jgi:L-threonylcarbamoyladenylate synthase
LNHWHLQQALRIIKAGGIIAYPTEAVYGLGCQPENYSAVTRILHLKRRPLEKGLIIIAAEIEQLHPYVSFTDRVLYQEILSTWPGPVTWVIPARMEVPTWIRGEHESIAVRVSDHPVVRDLCRLTGPLVSTSANPAGCPPATTMLKVRTYFGQSLDYILPGNTGLNHKPTEIRDALTGKVLRPGV